MLVREFEPMTFFLSLQLLCFSSQPPYDSTKFTVIKSRLHFGKKNCLI